MNLQYPKWIKAIVLYFTKKHVVLVRYFNGYDFFLVKMKLGCVLSYFAFGVRCVLDCITFLIVAHGLLQVLILVTKRIPIVHGLLKVLIRVTQDILVVILCMPNYLMSGISRIYNLIKSSFSTFSSFVIRFFRN